MVERFAAPPDQPGRRADCMTGRTRAWDGPKGANTMKTAYIVLGMHRSGTSSVAGTLALLGATPPSTLMRPAEDNPKGFWESEVLMTVDDAILAACGSRWDDWRPIPADALVRLEHGDLAERARRSLRAEFGDAGTIVLKDPRICRFYSLWRGWLIAEGYRPVVVMPIRSPVEVAGSLQARNGAPRNHGFRLWLRHVLDAEHTSRADARAVFDWSMLMSDWRATVAAVDRDAGTSLASAVPAHGEAVDAFLTPDLYRQRAADLGQDTVPTWVSATWDDLSSLATNPGDAAARARLDDTRRSFDAACDLFADTAS